jgi:hypothetical protein
VIRAGILSAFVTAALVLTAAAAQAHDIPNDVTIQAFLKPEGHRLRLLVRVPLESMRDMPVPTHPDGSLDVGRLQPLLADNAMLWIAQSIELFENDARLPGPRIVEARASLQSDRSFTSYEAALAHVSGPPLRADTKLYWTAGLVDALFEYPIESDRSDFSIRPKLARLGVRTLTVLRFVTPEGAVRPFEYLGDPGLVRLDPRWYQAAGRFVTLGFFHILDGTDHLLFLFCLVIPLRRLRALVPVVTAFTVAHSITLIASAYNLAPDVLWFPPLIETLIAMSIVYMALENIAAARLERRWLITFAFGLVHGFGFSFVLRQTMQFAGQHLLTSLLSFNLGVELGQLLVLLLLVPALELLFRFVVVERMGTIILSALIAHTAWHWMIERWEKLRQYTFEWPQMNLLFLLVVTRWLLIAVGVAALMWLGSGALRGRSGRHREREART